ncbi:MAG: oligosaccharide flippase family protein [Lentisphaeria bacterium]
MKSPIFKNTLTNYMVAAIRLPQAILMTRWMLTYLGREYYGFWSLLWSLFIYSLLLDFGFGVSLQKYTATGLYQSDSERYNKIISTVLTIYLVMALLIIAVTCGMSFFLDILIRVNDPEQLRYFRLCFLLFGCGAAVVFVTAAVPEILVGIQKIYIRNYVNAISRLLELLGVWSILFCGGSLLSLVIFTITLSILTNVVMAVQVWKFIPSLRIYPRLERKICREILNFSGFAYMNSLSRLILTKSGDLLVSIFHGLTGVGIYHLAGRLPDLCAQGASQYQENFSPISASLYASGDHDKLRFTLLNSLRWNSFAACFFLFVAWFLCDEALFFLFKVADPVVSELCRIMLLLMYLVIACDKIPRDFLLMTEKHRLLAFIAGAEAAANLLLDLILLNFFSSQCLVWVAIGVKAAFLLFLIFPRTLNYLQSPWWSFGLKVYLAPIVAMILPVLWIAWGKQMLGVNSSAFLRLACCGFGALLLYLCISFFLLLSAEERQQLRTRLNWRLKSRSVP